MRFKLNENLPTEIAADLRAAGHESETVFDEGIAGADDASLLEKVRSEGLVLLTMDKGIADIRANPPREHAGLVLFRPSISGRGAVLEFVRRRLPALLQVDLAGHLLVVTDHAVRIR